MAGWLRVAVRLRGKLLRVPTTWRILARRPQVLAGLFAMEGGLFAARSVPLDLKMLAEMRTASLIGCPW
ncbi:MAG TPA: hypothetical protein VHF47_04520 [Acidimicrobiales bacterium]|nr:hypothetical protein [Acidimicrobiales bacterium]